MPSLLIDVDASEVRDLARLYGRAGELLVRRATERAEQLTEAEAPKETGNLRQGISHDFEGGGEALQGLVVASARSGRTGARTGTLHLPSGKTRSVSLKPQPAFNYAEVVAKGRPAIRPKRAKVLLIAVSRLPAKGAYLTSGGKTYVLRPSAAAVAPNDYPGRAARRLEGELDAIAGEALGLAFE